MADSKQYRLADGVILSIGTIHTWLVDLEKDDEIQVDFRFIEPLEKLCQGWSLEGFEHHIPTMLESKLLEEGEAKLDPVLRKRLAKLDSVYMQEWQASLSERARRAYEATLDTHARRKRFFERVGQCPVLPETALRRALLVGDAEEVGRKKILLLGDDDLVCVPLAILGHEVTVFDIDDFLLRFLKERCASLELDVTIKERDLRDPLGSKIQESYDVFMTDPMSNKDCFEIFLSRAFALLKPAGVGYTAVYAPVSRLFSRVAEEMQFEIGHWYRRHNRYYSKYMLLHGYESDWVEIRKSADTVLKHPPTEFSVPLNLYREDYYHRQRSLVAFIDDIEEPRFARPLYLDLLLDVLAGTSTGYLIEDRKFIRGQEWTVVHCPTPDGYLALHVNRDRRQICLDMHPHEPDLEENLRNLLLSGYKSKNLNSSEVLVQRTLWDVRIR